MTNISMRVLGTLGTLLTLCTSSLAAQRDAGSAGGTLQPGPHAVGFRVIEARDLSRATGPAVDHRGVRNSAEPSVPVQMAVWYPARPAAAAHTMTTFDLWVVAAKKERFGSVTPADSARARGEVAFARQVSGVDTTRADARVDVVLASPTRVYRDAPAEAVPMPVAVIGASGSIASVSVLAEHLASHGWLVLASPSSDAGAALEVTQPRRAIDDRVRAIEFAVATAHGIAGADLRRLVVFGVNFDSYAAIEFQMRQMRASAIVTLNGWQTIDNRAAVMRDSPWFEPARARVPLLNFHWDEPGAAPANLTFLEELPYAARTNVVVRGLDHFGLVGNPMLYGFTAAERREGYAYLVRRVLQELQPVAAHASGAASSALPAPMLKDEWHRPALPAAPTRDEFTAMLADRDRFQEAVSSYREARRVNPALRPFTERDAQLFSFRFNRTGRLADAITLATIATEAFPRSSDAQTALGNLLRTAGDTAAAQRAFDAAASLRAQVPR